MSFESCVSRLLHVFYIYLQNTCFEVPLRKVTDADIKDMQLKYYNSAIHSAAFILPQFATVALAQNSSS